jgi:hypothetical protein
MRTAAKLIGAGVALAGASYATYVARTWFTYGRVVSASNDALLDRFMGDFEVGDVHAVDVAAPPDITLAAARAMRMDRSMIVRAIFRGRELLMRAKESAHIPRGIVDETTALGWGILAEEAHEIVLGAVTKPWEPNPRFVALPPEEFAAFDEPGFVKIVWTLRAEPLADGRSRLSSETRAVATDAASRAKFRIYWALLSPGIHLIRRAMLPYAKAEAERRAHSMPGDDVLPEACADMTHAIEIDVPPAQVWPWLVQMGCRRAGWYSWDALDNGGVPSAERIVPELQQIEVGDKLPMTPTGDDGFEVLRIEREKLLVIGSHAKDFEGTWAFILEPLANGRTRLTARYRAAFPPSMKMDWFVPLMKTVHTIMERKQLRTIKHHAEHCN